MNSLPTTDAEFSRTTNSLERALGVLCFNGATFREIAATPRRTRGALLIVLLVSGLIGLFTGFVFPSPPQNGVQLLPGLPYALSLAATSMAGWLIGWLCAGATATLLTTTMRHSLPFPVFLRLSGYCFLFGLFWLVPALGLLIVPISGFMALFLALHSATDLPTWLALLATMMALGTALLVSVALQSLLIAAILPLLLGQWGVPTV
jgi:hypothetical protein